MGYRGKERADEHRIDALEDAVDDKDDEIARLKAELAKKEAPPSANPRSASNTTKRKLKGRKSPVDPSGLDLPDGDEWELTLKEVDWKAFAWSIGVPAAIAAYLAYEHPDAGLYVQVAMMLGCAIFGAVIAAGRGVVLNRGDGSVRVWDEFVFRLHREVAAPNEVTMILSHTKKEKGPSKEVGILMIGSWRLSRGMRAKQRRLGKRMAGFLGVEFVERAGKTWWERRDGI